MLVLVFKFIVNIYRNKDWRVLCTYITCASVIVSVGICVDSVLRIQKGTHSNVEVAVTRVLKYTPDDKGGGGRQSATIAQ